MKKSVSLTLAAVVVLALIAVLVLWRRSSPTGSRLAASPTASPFETAAAPPAGKTASPLPTAPIPATPPGVLVKPGTPRRDSSEYLERRARVTAVLDRLKKLYEDVGTLSWDETKALVAKRRQAGEELVNALAALGPGGARAMADAFGEGADTRSKLLMAGALGKIEDPEASALVSELLQSEDSFSVRRELVSSLGRRKEAASSIVLADLLQNQTDARMRSAGVQALSGRPDALNLLNERVRSDASQDVRLESIHVIGSIGNPAAQQVLAGVAQGSMETALRQKAIQELARSYGEQAFDVFNGLLQDSSEAIRETAVRAIARLRTERGVALLNQTATSDASPAVRELARISVSQSQPGE